ncbi:hypothetical protein DVH24_010796 [Malus domestica]|uniref:S-locus receptor kinase C-terminal domain-containing protein n=1 Tax=Malus domestica TaxID=3750 RepID=A0A498JZ65_MALDO|nr:hypothetical protein DVH24_010796 [Malus domestica]
MFVSAPGIYFRANLDFGAGQQLSNVLPKHFIWGMLTWKPGAFTLSSVLPVFAEYVDVIKGKEIHGYAIRRGLDADIPCGCSTCYLIVMPFHGTRSLQDVCRINVLALVELWIQFRSFGICAWVTYCIMPYYICYGVFKSGCYVCKEYLKIDQACHVVLMLSSDVALPPPKQPGFYTERSAWMLWMQDKQLELIDKTLSDSCNIYEVVRCLHVGLLCVQRVPEDRPSMSSVVLMLSSDVALPSPKQPGFYTERSVSESPSSKRQCSENDVSISLIEPR